MFELSIQGSISSAHFLKGYEGKCKNLHGHNWKVEVIVSGDNLDDVGMISDFGILKEKLNNVLTGLDHVCLNDIEYFKEVNPTTENMSKYIYDIYSKEVSPLNVKCVKVWESDICSVVYYE